MAVPKPTVQLWFGGSRQLLAPFWNDCAVSHRFWWDFSSCQGSQVLELPFTLFRVTARCLVWGDRGELRDFCLPGLNPAPRVLNTKRPLPQINYLSVLPAAARDISHSPKQLLHLYVGFRPRLCSKSFGFPQRSDLVSSLQAPLNSPLSTVCSFLLSGLGFREEFLCSFL